MDLNTMLISVTVTLVSAIVIYLIYACGMRELTYDEVIAEQRRLHQAEFSSTKKTDKKEKKEKKKKKAKVEKEKPAVGGGGDANHVEEEEEELLPEVAPKVKVEVKVKSHSPEAEKPVSLSQSGKKKKRGDKHEPTMLEVAEALHTKEIQKETERSMRQQAEQQQEHITVMKVETTAMAPESKKRKDERDGKVKPSQPDPLQAELALEALIQSDPKVSSRSERDGKKNKKGKLIEDQAPTAGAVKTSSSDMIQMLRTATVSDSEIQKMIEVLLNKQGAAAPSMEWTKKSQKGDPLSLLRKQLEEKERALNEEHQFSITANSKLKELKQELAAERQRYASLEKSSQGKMEEQMREIQALHARMKSSHDQHAGEIHTLHKKMETMSGVLGGADQSQLLQLKEENKKLKEAAAKAGSGTDMEMKILREKLNLAMTKSAQMENQKFSIEKRTGDQIRKLETAKRDTEEVLRRKHTEISEELHRAENRNMTLTHDLDKNAIASRQLEQEVITLRNRIKETSQQDTVHALEARLKEAEKARSDMQATVSTTEQKLRESEKSKSESEKKLQELKQDNAMLVRELQTTKERTAGEGQEAPSLESSKAVHAETAEKEAEKRLIEKDQKIQHLQWELQDSLSKMKKLAEERDSQRNKNNDLREKNWKAMDALKKAETMAEAATELKTHLAQRDIKITQLNTQLDKAKNQKHHVGQEVQQSPSNLEVSQSPVTATDGASPQGPGKADDARIQELISSNECKARENEQLCQTLAQLQNKLGVIESKLKETEGASNAEVHSLKQQFNAAVSKSTTKEDQLIADLNQLRNKMSETEKQHVGHVTELQERYTVKEKQYVGDMEKLKSELSASQHAVQDLQGETAVIQDLKAQLAASGDSRQGDAAVIKDLKAQLAASGDRRQGDAAVIKDLKAQLAASGDSLQGDAAVIKDLKAQLAASGDSLQGDAAVIQDLKAQLAAAGDSRQGDTAVIKDLKAQLAASGDSLQGDAAVIQDLKAQLAASGDSLQGDAAVIKDLKAQLASAGDSLQGDAAVIKDLKAQLASAGDSLQGDAAVIQDLKAQLAAAGDSQGCVASLQAELEQVRLQLSATSASYEELNAAQTAAPDGSPALVAELQQKLTASEATAVRLEQQVQQQTVVMETQLVKASVATETTSNNSQLENQLKELSQLKTELATVKKENNDLRVGCETATKALTKAEKSAEEIAQVQAELEAKAAEVSSLQAELEELRSSQNGAVNGSSSQGELTQLRTQVGHLSSQLQEEKTKNDELRMQVKSGGRTGSFLSRSSTAVELQEQLEARQTEIDTLRDIVKDYWNKNNDLTEKVDLLENDKQQAGAKLGAQMRQQVKDLTAQLEAASQKVTQLEAANKLAAEVAGPRDNQQARSTPSKPEMPTALLKRLFPQAKVKSTMTEDEWALTFEKEAKKMLTSSNKPDSHSNGTSPELQDSKQVQAKLQAQVQHYKEVLADTEGILNKLQSSVESEEQKWQQRVQQAEAETKQTKEEVIRLKEQLSDSTSQSMQSLASLQSLQATSVASSQQSLFEEELSTLRDQLTDERKSKKELSSANVRLNSLVKIGQDALRAEQELVKKLQKQADSKSQAMANGSPSPSSKGASASNV